MPERVDEHVQTVKRRGAVSEGGVDVRSGVATGALAGAILGASGGPIGLVAGALVGGAMGGIAFSGPEQPDFPEPWDHEVEELRVHAQDAAAEVGARDAAAELPSPVPGARPEP